jgi:putative membrane-bound dehydrogenase-like protein
MNLARWILLGIAVLAWNPPGFSETPPVQDEPKPPAEPPNQPPYIATSDPLSPQEEQRRFHLPPGFEIQLFASEPDIRKPMNMAFDEQGRLLVTQSVEYPFPAKPGNVPRDTVKIFDASSGESKPGRAGTYVDGLNIPIGLAPVPGGVLVYSIPKIYRCLDTRHQGVTDTREPVYGDFGSVDTHGMASSFTAWVDGWVYACHGFSNRSVVKGTDGQATELISGNVFRMRPDGSHLEAFAHGRVNPFGMCFDPLGNQFVSDCHTLPAYMVLRGGWYPTFWSAAQGREDGLGYAPSMMDHLHGSTAIAGIVCYSAPQFPEEYQGTLFIGNPVTGRIDHDRLDVHGSSYKAVELPDFLRCDDPWFRPVDLKLAPDGSLFVADFYNRIIGHYEVPLTHPGRDHDRGRIWRIVYTGTKGAPTRKMPDLAKATTEDLVGLLGDENLAVRTMATNALAARSDEKAIPLLGRVFGEQGTEWQKAHALWVLERLHALGPELVQQASADPKRGVRVHLWKALAERKRWDSVPALLELARKSLGDPDAFVRRAASEALGQHPDRANIEPLLDLWAATPADDTHLLYVLRLALRNQLELPGSYASLTELLSRRPGDLGRLANVSLGVRNADSAEFLLKVLEGQKVLQGAPTPYVHDVVRYGGKDLLSRIETLLGQIERQSGPREKLSLLRAVFRARQERGVAAAVGQEGWERSALSAALSGQDVGLLKQALPLILELRIGGFEAELARIAERTFGNTALRQPAIKALAVGDPERSVPALTKILGDAEDQMALRLEAAAALASLNTAKSREGLLAALKTAPYALTIEIAKGLAASREGAELLLRAVDEGKTSSRILLDPVIKGRVEASGGAALSERIAKLTAGAAATDDRIEKAIGTRKKGFLASKPLASAGAEVFQKTCAVCHRIGGKGAKVGPELDGIGNRGLDRLLEDVLDPNRNVDQAFRASIVKTIDGRVLSGLVVNEDGQVLTISEGEGKETRIPLAQIEARVKSMLSPMPSNFVDTVPEPDFYNLIAFLLSQR